MKRHRLQRGFTLMELMVVIIIVAILAAVAVPLYINYVKDARRTEAKGAIAAVISAQQVYFQEFNTYASDITLLKVDLADVDNNWTIEIASADANGFSVSADGTASAATLDVCCTYSRNANPVWTDESSGCSP